MPDRISIRLQRICNGCVSNVGYAAQSSIQPSLQLVRHLNVLRPDSGVSSCVNNKAVGEDTVCGAATASWCGGRSCNVQRCRAERDLSSGYRVLRLRLRRGIVVEVDSGRVTNGAKLRIRCGRDVERTVVDFAIAWWCRRIDNVLVDQRLPKAISSITIRQDGYRVILLFIQWPNISSFSSLSIFVVNISRRCDVC